MARLHGCPQCAVNHPRVPASWSVTAQACRTEIPTYDCMDPSGAWFHVRYEEVARWLRIVSRSDADVAQLNLLSHVGVLTTRWIYDAARRPKHAEALTDRVTELLVLVELRADPEAFYLRLQEWGASV